MTRKREPKVDLANVKATGFYICTPPPAPTISGVWIDGKLVPLNIEGNHHG